MVSSVQRNKRPRQDPSNHTVDASRGNSSDDNLVLAQVPKRKRLQRVIIDSDDDDFQGLGEPDGGHILQSAAMEVQASGEAPVPQGPSTPSEQPVADDELDAILAVELDVQIDDDMDVQSEIGDEEYILGPDDHDDIFGEVQTEPRTVVCSTTSVNETFAHILRNAIVHLAEWAKGENLMVKDKAGTATTLGYWALLGRVSVDFLLALYLPVIPPEVQALFEKEEWSVEDFLSLPLATHDTREGIYGNFATGDIDHRTDIGCDTYIGSARCLEKRILEHLHMAKRSASELPARYSRSFHYRQICRNGVQVNFRRLAAFDSPVDPGYLLLLEGIFVILFKTYNHPGYTTKWATRASYDLVAKTRASLDLPAISWRGMNAAWPLRQGFENRSCKSPSPCCNPACGKMTYPRSLIPEGQTKYWRLHGDPGNPLGPYLCDFCARYRTSNGELPRKEVLALFANRLRIREAAGDDPACHICDRVESQFPEKWCWSQAKGKAPKKVWYRGRHQFHKLLPDKLLCGACYCFIKIHGRVRTAEEVETCLAHATLVDARQAGAELTCSNCEAVEGSENCSGKHVVNKQLGEVLCRLCSNHYAEHGKHRDPHHRLVLEAKLRVQKDRKEGKAIKCGHCGKKEDKGGRVFIFGKKSLKPVCAKCYDRLGLR